MTHLAGAGLCLRCYARSPHRIASRAGNLAASLDAAPAWLPGFASYLATRHHADCACQMITVLGRLLRGGGPAHPQGLLDRAATVSVPLAGALEDFFTRNHLALPPGHDEDRATARRHRRLQAIPAPLRPAAEKFAEHELNGRLRARHAGTRPRQHSTIEGHLTTIRDLAIFLTATTAITDWATVSAADIEAFLATQPARAAHRLGALRRFFGFAARRRLILASPAAGMIIRQPSGFHGPALSVEQQRSLFRRWTAGGSVHPHEAARRWTHGPRPRSSAAWTTGKRSTPTTLTCSSPASPRPPGRRPTADTSRTPSPAPASGRGSCGPPGCLPWSTPPTPSSSPQPSA